MAKIEIVSVGDERKVLLDGKDITGNLFNVEVDVDRFGSRVTLNYKCIDTSLFGDENVRIIHSCPISETTGDK